MDYLHDLEKHGVSLTEYQLSKVLDSFPLYGEKHRVKKFISIESHPWVVSMQRALEAFIVAQVCSYSYLSSALFKFVLFIIIFFFSFSFFPLFLSDAIIFYPLHFINWLAWLYTKFR